MSNTATSQTAPSSSSSSSTGIGKIDTRNRSRGVWLVKVPKYLSQQWQKNAGSGEVGRLKVVSNMKGKTDVTFHLNRSNTTAQTTDSDKIPEEHNFIIGSLNQQILAVVSEDKAGLDDPAHESGKLILEGRVVQKAECRPPPSLGYMKMKINEIQKVNQPERTVKQMEKAVVKYKPISQHAEATNSQKQKDKGKNVRLEKPQLMELIFQAFEKHQYYKLVDLARITQQPPNYVKEILVEIAQYNINPPHRYTWELKPEYRHYKNDQE